MKKHQFLGISDEGFHEVAYTEWGVADPEFPTVICVHGYTRNSRDFDALAAYLSSGGSHVFCPDIVGRGDSSWFKDSHHYQFNQYVNDMNALIARTQAKQIDWIGTSMGGIIGMLLAALPNSPIRKLILNDIGPQIPLSGLKKLIQYAGKDPEFRTLDEAKEYFKVIHAEFGELTEKQWSIFTQNSIEQRAPNVFVTKLDPGIKNPKSTQQWVSDFFHHPHKALEGILFDIDLWSIWKQIHCPVLVIHGMHSELLTLEIINKMQKIHEKTESYTVKNAGHAPALLNLADHKIISQWLNQ